MEAQVNGKLRALGEPEMTLAEAMGLRLYTGPLFVKYNSVLRGLNSEVGFLQKQLVGLCCAAGVSEQLGKISFVQAKDKVNRYTTTLHVINSGIVKTSKLTFASKVYRGVSGMALPDAFWQANSHGVRGGIEGAFMSTTKDRRVAMQYAASGGKGIVFEIQQGMIDRGADVSWASQYPHEAEILFAPLTGLEVQSTRVHGSVLVVGVSLSVNLSSLTIEQVIAKRKKLVSDAADGAVLQTRSRVLESSTPEFADEAAKLVRLACGEHEGLLRYEPDFFNDDENLSWAVDAVTKVAQVGLGAATLRVSERGRMCELKEGEVGGVHALSGEEFTWLLCAHKAKEVTALPSWLKESRLVAQQLQTVTLEDLDSLASVDGLSGCTGLQTLKLWRLELLASVAGLSGCAGLQTLTLEDLNSLASVDGLSGCTGLQTLTLSRLDSLASVDGLSGCAGLQTLTLKHLDSLASVDGLSGCAGLQTLTLEWLDSLASVDGLSGCTGLQTLTLWRLESLASVAGLSGCAGLQTLTLQYLDSLASVDSLSGCAGLQTLTLSRLDSLASVDVFSGCAGLQTLTLSRLDSLASVDSLSGCAGLQTLTLSRLNSLASVDGLSGCAGLQTLTLEDLKSLASVDGLSGCAGLQSLEFKEESVLMDKLASMPDLSALVSLKVKGLPSHLQAWENSGRKRFFRA